MDYPYFRSAWRVVVVALLCAAFIPLVLIGGGMYYYAASIMESDLLDTLRTDARHHQKAVDGFLAERVRDLELLSETLGVGGLKRQEILTDAFLALQARLPAFIDLGVIDADGRHLAYVGPHDLLSKRYGDAEWFKAVRDRRTYVSDVFMGHRKAPHFIIAVKSGSGAEAWILRATVNTAYFQELVLETARTRAGDAFMVNDEGRFQVRGTETGQLMAPSGLDAVGRFEGVRIVRDGNRLLAMVRQEQVPWMSVIAVERGAVYKALHRVRFMALMVFFIAGACIVATVLLTTDYLVSRLESTRRSLRFLDQQLRSYNRMAAAVQMSYGFLRDIRDGMANIDAAAVLVAEGAGDAEVRRSGDQIRSQLSRIRKTIDRFIGLVQAREPVIGDVNVNEVLDDIVDLFEGQFRHADIRIVREYGSIPPIRGDLDSLRQVFQNLLLNAVSAIGTGGVITLSTTATPENVTATVADNGPGIPPEHLDRIFEPLFTTRSNAVGLGLSISRETLEKLGGAISAASEPGRGTIFTVVLPFRMTPHS